MSNNTKILFFTPHPDDIEMGMPFTYLEAIRLGNEVVEVLMTNGEYGTTNNEFKGKRLSKIRMKEIDKANAVFERGTNNKVRVVKMGYIDGYLPVNKESLRRVMELLRREKPDIIFTCDPWFAQDYHEDHLNTGRLVYFALKRLKKSELPKRVYYYLSNKTRFYIKCRWKDFKIVEEALLQHRTQVTPMFVKMMLVFYNKLSILRHLLKTRSASECFREQEFKDGVPLNPAQFEEMPFRTRWIYYLFSTVTLWGSKKLINLSPEKLNLRSEYDLSDILKTKDHRYKRLGAS
jgi:LmbE family N-acetylglucosaminyl deacetylase